MKKSNITSNYYPVSSLLVYKQQTKAYNEDNFYIEESRVVKTPKGYQTTGYSPIRINVLQKIAASMFKKKIENFNNFIPADTVYFENKITGVKVAWTLKSHENEIIHKEYGKVKVKLPNLLFYLDEDTIYVYCYKTKTIDEKTKLYHVPLPNIYDDCHICLGDTNVPENFTSINEIKNFVYNFFFKTEFNEFHSNKIYKENVISKLESKHFEINNKSLILKDTFEKCIS